MSDEQLPHPYSPDRPVPGLAKMRRQITALRALLVVALALLLVIGVWSVVGIAFLSAQVSSLESKVDRNAQAATSAAQPAPQASAPAAVESKQVTAATPLPSDIAVPTGVDAAGAVLVGDPNASEVVEVFVDYQCPFCQKWETEVGAGLMAKALQPGSDVLVKQYNLAFLKETSRTLEPPGASARAASAASCVIGGEGAEFFTAYNAAVFASADPTEPPTQFATDVLAELAAGLGAGEATITCINEQRYLPYIAALTQASFARGVGGTPTVTLNGVTLESSFNDPALLALVQG